MIINPFYHHIPINHSKSTYLYFCYLNWVWHSSIKNFKLEMDEQFNNEVGEDFQIFAENHTTSPDEAYFDEVVGALQDIMLDEQFERIQDKFMRTHCSIFQDSEQNKKEYMPVFNLYQQEIEQFVQQSLKNKVNNFDMAKFVGLLQGRTDQIDEMILDMIQSFTEFQSFKKIMVQYRHYIINEEKLKGLTIKSNRIN